MLRSDLQSKVKQRKGVGQFLGAGVLGALLLLSACSDNAREQRRHGRLIQNT
jgi:hypothetical protein